MHEKEFCLKLNWTNLLLYHSKLNVIFCFGTPTVAKPSGEMRKKPNGSTHEKEEKLLPMFLNTSLWVVGFLWVTGKLSDHIFEKKETFCYSSLCYWPLNSQF